MSENKKDSMKRVDTIAERSAYGRIRRRKILKALTYDDSPCQMHQCVMTDISQFRKLMF
jgi:hypothetical protein